MDEATGQLFLTKEIDLEEISFDRFLLEIQATQKDNPLKTAEAKVNYFFSVFGTNWFLGKSV
jgi:hypothetical protein